MACVRCYRPEAPVLLSELMEVDRNRLADHNGEMPAICRGCSQSLARDKAFFAHWGFELALDRVDVPSPNGASEPTESAKKGPAK